jgi:alkanesulfonate monooxygenase SsuD/methylene tetrahydromethanopterin reductase-like flavin-dependent oxidoreductase (luciferase family)
VQYAEAAEAVGLDSMWLPDKSVRRNPTPEITCMFAMTARCAVEAKANTLYDKFGQ